MTLERSKAELSRSAFRVGDAQRAECAATLTDAFAKGELTLEEFNERTELCLAAVTDVDLDRLTSDLLVQAKTPTVALVNHQEPGLGAVNLLRLIGFEVVLLVVAYVLGVDLESELRSSYAIAFEVWLVGNLAGLAGAFVLRPSTSKSVE